MAQQPGSVPKQGDMHTDDPHALAQDSEGGQTVEKLIQLRAKIDQELNQRLTQNLCLLLADVVGSTSFYQKYGDVEGRLFIQRHNDILFPLIAEQGGKVVKTIGDAVMASFEDSQQALDCAIAIQCKLWEANQQGDEEVPLRTKISLHRGNALVETNDVYGDLVNMSARLNEMAGPDQILISQAVYSQVQKRKDLPMLPVSASGWKEDEKGIAVYEVVWRQQAATAGNPVAFRNFRGTHRACFYCGLREHPVSSCPSKELTRNSRRLERLSYLPLHEVLSLFRQQNLNASPAPEEEENRVVEAFYEISLPYQLRFLTIIWLTTDDDWSAVTRQQTVIAHPLAGTRLWMGYDCLRVGRHEQAKIFLLTASDSNPGDYKPVVALGFWAMEQDDPSTALQYWRKALALTKTSLQAAYIHLLMHRLYETNNKIKEAHQELQRSLSKDTYLYEARYRQIALLVKENRDEKVLGRLQKLIREDPGVYLKVALDPAFAPLREKIHTLLTALLQEAQAEALKHMDSIAQGVNILREWYQQQAQEEMGTIERTIERLHTLIKSDSYAGYSDAAHEGAALQERIPKLLSRRKEHLRNEFTNTLDAVQNRLSALASSSHSTRRHPVKERVAKLQQQSALLQAQDYISTPEQFWQAWKTLQRLKAAVQQIDPSTRRRKRGQRGTDASFMPVFLSGLGGSVAVNILLSAVFGYLQYFAGRSLSGRQWFVLLACGALGGFFLGSTARWGVQWYRSAR